MHVTRLLFHAYKSNITHAHPFLMLSKSQTIMFIGWLRKIKDFLQNYMVPSEIP